MIVDDLLTLEQNETFNDEGLEVESNMLDQLMHKAISRGYLITDDLLAAFPAVEDAMGQLEEIFIQLINQGIEVYNDEAEAEENRRMKDDLAGEADMAPPPIDPFDLSGIAADDTISLYLKEMARVPLLAPAEEILLAKNLERGRKAQKKLTKGQFDLEPNANYAVTSAMATARETT
jgi:RNA polymerase primary sigma factor